MPYPEKLLGDGEQIVLDFHPHWSFLLAPIGWTALALLLIGGGVWVERRPNISGIGLILILAIVVAWFFIAGIQFIHWRMTEYVLTTDRLIIRSGIIAKRGREIPLDKINDIAFSQSIFERMLGTGDLIVESAGELGQSHYEDIPKPNLVQNEIYRQMELNQARMMSGRAFAGSPSPYPAPPPYAPPGAHGTPSGGAAPTTATGDVPQQIEQLARLRDQGLLTPEEFELKKRELLGRM